MLYTPPPWLKIAVLVRHNYYYMLLTGALWLYIRIEEHCNNALDPDCLIHRLVTFILTRHVLVVHRIVVAVAFLLVP